jgi:uncharacterized protein Yka (UPF0111/DUF47 family)
MDPDNFIQSLQERSDAVHDAIKSVAHDVACRSHFSRHEERLEGRLRQVSEEVTDAARRLKELR